jgi:hypothetical protein
MTRTKPTLFLLLAVVACAVSLAYTAPLQARSTAGALDGHWEAEITGDGGRTFTFSFDFQAHHDTLTGTVELSTRDDAQPITSGRIKGKNISFRGFGIWTGILAGSSLELTRELDYGKKQHMTAHRKAKD